MGPRPPTAVITPLAMSRSFRLSCVIGERPGEAIRLQPLSASGGWSEIRYVAAMVDARAWLLSQGFRVHQALWWTRAVTLGVRALVLDGRSVLLVRHTYRPGWFLPGGGVDRGESAEGAIVRELREEAGILCAERPALHGFYRNKRHDHVACYVLRRFERSAPPPGHEIAETGFFPVDALPPGTSPATQARLAEVLRGAPLSDTW